MKTKIILECTTCGDVGILYDEGLPAPALGERNVRHRRRAPERMGIGSTAFVDCEAPNVVVAHNPYAEDTP